MNRFISVAEAAAQTSLSRRFLYKIIAEKRLQHFIINPGKSRPGRILIDEKELEDFIRAGRVEAR